MRLTANLFTCFLAIGLLVVGSGCPPAFAQDAEQAGDQELNYSRRGADSCLRCHGERSEFPVLAMFGTAHASRGDPRSPFAGAQCETCHGPGGAHERKPRGEDTPPMRMFGQDVETPVEEQNQVCLGCHTDHGRMSWIGSAHEEQELSCSACHQVHVERDPMLDAESQQQTCYGCHPRTRAQAHQASSHPLRFGKMTCTSCHDPHSGFNDFQLTQNTVNDTCYTCHAEKRGPFLWEHAPATEDCTLCHNAHGSNHSAMLKQRPPLLCQQCHMPAGHPSVAYTTDSSGSEFDSRFLLGASCGNCHSQVHGSNHPSGVTLAR